MSFLKNIFKPKKSNDSSQNSKVHVQNEYDINKPIENPKLKELLKELKQEANNEVLSNIYEEVAMNAKFVTVMTLSSDPVDNGDGTSTFQKDSTMRLYTINTEDNQSFFPLFTDWDEVYKWKELVSPKGLIVGFDDISTFVINADKHVGLVINPFGDNFVIDMNQLRFMKERKDSIKNGYVSRVLKEETKIMLGEPKEYPSEMVNALKDYLKNSLICERVWLRLMMVKDEQSYLLVIETNNEREFVIKNLVEVAKPFLKNMYLDLIIYDESNANYVLNVEPFYCR